ncbi:MAG TPA: TonB-dependent receptor [Solimonas sp.]
MRRLPALLIAAALVSPLALAQSEARFSLQLPAQPLSQSLAAAARQAGIELDVDISTLPDRDAPALDGEYTAAQALAALLAGSGLQAVALRDNRFAIREYGSDAVAQLDTIVVTANGSQVALPQAYAGGQVATGGRVGLFGNLDMMDTPFSSTNYTAELIKNQQARSVADVVQNDPAVRTARGFGNFQELYFIRGFPVYSDDMAYNGLYGILPRQYLAAEFVERVEVFRGANSFLNGAAPTGSGVGGLINVVPKRAPDGGLNRLTLGFENDGQLYSAVDVARRYGTDGAFGVRGNAVRRDGDGAIEDEDRELGAASLGIDYRSPRLRLSADIGWQDHRINAPRPSVTPGDGIPQPPAADSNFAQRWTFTEERDLFGTFRGEYDLGERTHVWAATGLRNTEENNVLANPTANRDGSTSSYRFDNAREDRITTAEIGLRTSFDTGSVGHRVSLSATTLESDSKNAYAFSSFAGFAGNLYAPFDAPPPNADFFTGGDLNHPLTTAKTETSSIALADTLSLFERRLLVTVGARYQTIENRSYDYNTGAEDPAARYDESAVTPIAAIVYKISPTTSLYANYIESLVPGDIVPQNVNGTTPANAGEVFDPFKSKQVEVGAKYDGGTLGATLSLFRINQPSSRFDGVRVDEDGEQINQGIEVTWFGQPVDGIRVLGGVTLLQAELTQTEGGANDGNEPIGVPNRQANLGAEWDLPFVDRLSLDGRLVYTAEQAAAESNTARIPSWSRIDLGTRYVLPTAATELTFRARVDNLLDRDYWASAGGFPGANYLVLGAPRTFTVSVSMDF